ncbi:type I-F CRISPR-associated endoribonuclease Cas6/Csy4 [Pararobbsia alpina]|uniref:CRISPR-associated endonuclease Cas6/Csy4 n=1 Tax=Pararobbsia alpina TaxID=621374 RepID=A0A6S7BLN0_9BURK|nr:type I-F CRISPR-associated endoribonuclease Cas6/Csy4 [Pararobbsia alpina]CAB3804960.1 CRISPR-associated endonuclease Cas6/Csy4 [Pararobbsia alpina]
MNAYLEINILPDPEFIPTTLMNILFGKLHGALAAHGRRNIGVSFPDVREDSQSLGTRLRIHGDASSLGALIVSGCTAGLLDHIAVGEITRVPTDARHRAVRRVQAKSSPERQRRRLMARRGIDADTARQTIPDCAAERLQLPYLILASKSTGAQFRLFIEHLPIQQQAVEGEFTAYGLSATATVPWF